MKKLFALLALLTLAIIPLACGGGDTTPSSPAPAAPTNTNTPTGSPTYTSTNTPTASSTATNTPTATPTSTPLTNATISYGGGNTFSPASVTIRSGGVITWDSSFNSPAIHNLYLSNSGQSACLITNSTYPVSSSALSTGTYKFYCSNHSSCGSSCNTGCTGGMQGTIVVVP